jgi:hypothetical protein
MARHALSILATLRDGRVRGAHQHRDGGWLVRADGRRGHLADRGEFRDVWKNGGGEWTMSRGIRNTTQPAPRT